MAEPSSVRTEVAEHPPGTAGVLGTLGIRGDLFLAQLINFAIIVFVMWRWVYRPLVRMMDERAKKISDGLAFSKEATRALNDAASEKEKMIRQAGAEAQAQLDEARAKAETLRREKLEQTKVEIDRLVADAKTRIVQERQSAYDALQGEIASLVTLVSAKVATGLDDKAHRQLIERAIREIERA